MIRGGFWKGIAKLHAGGKAPRRPSHHWSRFVLSPGNVPGSGIGFFKKPAGGFDKFSGDPDGIFNASVAAQRFDCHMHQRGPDVGKGPLAADAFGQIGCGGDPMHALKFGNLGGDAGRLPVVLPVVLPVATIRPGDFRPPVPQQAEVGEAGVPVEKEGKFASPPDAGRRLGKRKRDAFESLTGSISGNRALPV